MENTEDADHLAWIIARAKTPDEAARDILNSEWILRRDYNTVLNFLRGAVQGLEGDLND